jgi:hypothetical protein
MNKHPLNWQCKKNKSLQMLNRKACDEKRSSKKDNKTILERDCEGCTGPEFIGVDNNKGTIKEEAQEIMIQLGHKKKKSNQMINRALETNHDIISTEDLIQKIHQDPQKTTKTPKSYKRKPTDYKKQIKCSVCGKLLKDDNRTGLCVDHYNEARREGKAEPLIIKIDFGEYPDTPELLQKIKEDAVASKRPLNSQILFDLDEYYRELK